VTLKALKKTYIPVPHIHHAKLPPSIRKYAFIIADMDRTPEGWCFGLVTGYICTSSETHQVMESSLRECLGAFLDVEPCHCADECGEAWKARTAV